MTQASATIVAPWPAAAAKYVASGLASAPVGQPASHQPSYRHAGRSLKSAVAMPTGSGATGRPSAAKPRARMRPCAKVFSGGSG